MAELAQRVQMGFPIPVTARLDSRDEIAKLHKANLVSFHLAPRLYSIAAYCTD